MLLSLKKFKKTNQKTNINNDKKIKKDNKTNKQQQNEQTQQQHITAPVYITGGDGTRQFH